MKLFKDKKIVWEKWKRLPQYTGTVDGERAFVISGHLCVQDMRKADGKRASPTYSIKDVADGKRIAFDLLNGYNKAEHFANRKAWEEKDRKSTAVLQDAEKFLKDLNKKEEAAKKTKNVSTNFVHVVPNSHFYGDLNHIKTTIESGIFDMNHLLVGINNTIEQGYKLTTDDQIMDFGGYILGEIWAGRLVKRASGWFHKHKSVSIVDLYKKHGKLESRKISKG